LDRIDRAESPRFTNTLAVFVWPDQATYTAPSDLLRMSRIAVGDPDHVPAGRYARRALECLGLWDELEDQVVPAADARASLQMLLTGATPAAIGYTSDSRFVDDRIRVVAMPTECAPEIRYGLATVAGSAQPATANAFLSFILRDDQRSVWTSLGFVGAR
jgi:molybdate transport system substrate-binding protein